MPSFVLLKSSKFPSAMAFCTQVVLLTFLHLSLKKRPLRAETVQHSVSQDPAWSLEHTDRCMKFPITQMSRTVCMRARSTIAAPVTMTTVFLLHAVDPL